MNTKTGGDGVSLKHTEKLQGDRHFPAGGGGGGVRCRQQAWKALDCGPRPPILGIFTQDGFP